MSTVDPIFNNGQSAQFNRNVAKIFLGFNTWDNADMTNSTYDDLVLAAGTVLGRNSTTKEVVALESDASDGSQFPIGILQDDVTIPAGETFDVAYATGGRVAEEMLVLVKDGDTLDTVIDGKIIRDRIGSDSVGLQIIRTADDLTGFDNELEN
jgi:hypothetical protein